MKKIFVIVVGAFILMNLAVVCAVEKFDVLPDLPEPLAAAQASSITNTGNIMSSEGITTASSIGQEPNILSVVFSLLFVILLIYATGIIYTKLNKVGLKTLKKQIGDSDNSHVSVISTTQLGNNKSLHVVELDGKRMLIGASTNSIDLIKDLGSYPPNEIEDGEFSKIEIPNIRIPKIEIPKIEFPNIGFTKTFKKKVSSQDSVEESNENKNSEGFEFSEIYEESPDGIIDRLFTPSQSQEQAGQATETESVETAHKIDPDEYALYKKYL